jgi:hypothetical protein
MVLISAGIMSVSLLRKNEPFFNIHEIVQEYRKLIRGSTIVFFILPLLFSVGLALLYTAGTRFYSEPAKESRISVLFSPAICKMRSIRRGGFGVSNEDFPSKIALSTLAASSV